MKDNKIEFLIEKNIPIPSFKSKIGTYPLDKLEVNDSMLVHFTKDIPTRKTIYSIRSAISNYCRANESKKFVTRSVAEGIRVWRTE